MSEEKKMNLLQKLVEVRKEVTYIQKKEEGHNFKFAACADLLLAIRPKMDEVGVILQQNIESCERVQVKKGASEVTETRAWVSHVFINADDPTEQIVTKDFYFSNDERMGGYQSIGCMKTYAERYFLFKFFQVATDEDSPEIFDKKQREKVRSNVQEEREEREAESISSTVDPISDEMLMSIVSKFVSDHPSKMDIETTKQWLHNARKQMIDKPEQLLKKLQEFEMHPDQMLVSYNSFVKRRQATAKVDQ
jgi:hypothetical protein